MAFPESRAAARKRKQMKDTHSGGEKGFWEVGCATYEKDKRFDLKGLVCELASRRAHLRFARYDCRPTCFVLAAADQAWSSVVLVHCAPETDETDRVFEGTRLVLTGQIESPSAGQAP